MTIVLISALIFTLISFLLLPLVCYFLWLYSKTTVLYFTIFMTYDCIFNTSHDCLVLQYFLTMLKYIQCYICLDILRTLWYDACLEHNCWINCLYFLKIFYNSYANIFEQINYNANEIQLNGWVNKFFILATTKFDYERFKK